MERMGPGRISNDDFRLDQEITVKMGTLVIWASNPKITNDLL